MRSIWIGLAVGLAGLGLVSGAGAVSLEGSAQPERDPAVTALPALGRVGELGQTRYCLRGRLDRKRAAELVRLARDLHADVSRRFLRGRHPKAELPPVEVCLFASPADYLAFTQTLFGTGNTISDYGFYSPLRRLVLADLSIGTANLRHELVHPLLFDEFGELPYWLNEGLAELYATAGRKGRAFVLRPEASRLRRLRRALRAGELPSLDALARSGYREVYGPQHGLYYGMGIGVLGFLERRGKLDAFVRELARKPMTAERQQRMLGRFVGQKAFTDWLRGTGAR
ncbi:MAG: hypothetical protein JXR96_30490 [Deltaproteobacteria bacterium]|nr:hypothetical protein [Deltaproteobacteria bacterium]